MWINNQSGYLQDWVTQVWVKITGRRFDPNKETWLLGPIGGTNLIECKFVQNLAEEENLEIKVEEKNVGLIENFYKLNLNELKKKL